MYPSTYFTYKGINSKEYNLKIVTMEKTYTEIFGIKKDIQMETRGDGRIFSYKSTNKTPETRQLIIAHCDEWDRPLKHDTKWRREVAEWLLTGEFIPIWFDEFEDDDLCYYIKVLDISRWDNFNEQGYLTITFQPLDDCMYTRPRNEHYMNFSNTTPRTIQILNDSNTNRNVSPYIELENLQDGNYIKLTNKTTGQIVELKNIPLESKIQLYNDVQIPYINKDNYDFNSDNFNFEWFYLKDGMNYIEILGKCQVSFNLSFPVML